MTVPKTPNIGLNKIDRSAPSTTTLNLKTYIDDNMDTLDAAIANLSSLLSANDAKNSVRVATTANITLSGTQTIDGVALVAGDRVLVKNQTTASQNGIYVVAAGSWTRPTDADASSEVTSGLVVRVNEGTANGGSEWYLSTPDPITLGTTSLTFVQSDGLMSIDDTVTATNTPSRLKTLISMLAFMFKLVTGKPNWYTPPAISLETVSTRLNQAVNTSSLPKFAGVSLEGSQWPAIVWKDSDDTANLAQMVLDGGYLSGQVRKQSDNTWIRDLIKMRISDGALFSKNNTLDDGNGNMTLAGAFYGKINSNLVPNGNAEFGMATWTVIGNPGWVSEQGYDITDMSMFANRLNSGGNYSVMQTPKMRIGASRQCTISFDYDTTGVTQGACYFGIYAYDSSGSLIGTGAFLGQGLPLNTTGWPRWTQTFTTPADTANIVLQFGVDPNTNCNGGGFVLRRIKIERGSFATPYTMEGSFLTPLKTGLIWNDYTQANRSHAQAGTATGQAIAHATMVKVIFGDQWRDNLNEYDQATGRFTCQKSGVYQVNARVTYAGVATGANYYIHVYINNAPSVSDVQSPPLAGAPITLQASNSYMLNAGDYIEIFAYQNSGSSKSLVTDAYYNNVSITRTA